MEDEEEEEEEGSEPERVPQKPRVPRESQTTQKRLHQSVLHPQWYAGQLPRVKAPPRKSWSTYWSRMEKLHREAQMLQQKALQECEEAHNAKRASNHASADTQTRQTLLEASRSRTSLMSESITSSKASQGGGSRNSDRTLASAPAIMQKAEKAEPKKAPAAKAVAPTAAGQDKLSTRPKSSPQRQKVPGEVTLLQNTYEPAKVVSKSGRVGLRGVKTKSDVERFSKEVKPYSQKAADIRASFKLHKLGQVTAMQTSACTWDALHYWKASEMDLHPWAQNAEKGLKYYYEWNSP